MNRHHFPCAGGCGELADECTCPRPNPLGSFTISMTGPDTTRPAGQPGTVRQAFTYPAVRDDDTGTVRYWRDTESTTSYWIVAPARLAESFEPGPEWQADCDHVYPLPWMVCASESDCRSLRLEEHRVWGDRW